MIPVLNELEMGWALSKVLFQLETNRTLIELMRDKLKPDHDFLRHLAAI